MSDYGESSDEWVERAPWSARGLLSRIEHKEFRISGKPQLLASGEHGRLGFIKLWAYSKNGETGKFKIDGQHENHWTLKQELVWFTIGKTPDQLSTAMESRASVELDKPTSDVEVTAVVPLMFIWEISMHGL
jgi:hypothetical protein